MDELKHTPGPWELSGEDEPAEVRTAEEYVHLLKDGSRPRKDRRPFRVTVHVAGGFPGLPWKTVSEERRANARLIAAAPELLEALVNILEAYDFNDTAGIREEIERSRPVIRKATTP